jgi:hypothetical protein
MIPKRGAFVREAIIIGLIFFLANAFLTAIAVEHPTPSLLWDLILWGSIAGMAITVATFAIFLSSQLTRRPFWIPMLLVNLGICAIAAGLFWHFGNSGSREINDRKPQPATSASRIVVSKFVIGKTNTAKPDDGYVVNLYMINRGNIPGHAPINNFSFESVGNFMSEADIDAKMASLLELAIKKPPPKNEGREQLEVGVEHWMTLPYGLTPDAWKLIASGEKRFYLFVILTYTDDRLAPGQFWISEYCASQSENFSYFQLCPGNNRTWLHKE